MSGFAKHSWLFYSKPNKQLFEGPWNVALLSCTMFVYRQNIYVIPIIFTLFLPLDRMIWAASKMLVLFFYCTSTAGLLLILLTPAEHFIETKPSYFHVFRKGFFHSWESDTKILTEYVFRLPGRHQPLPSDLQTSQSAYSLLREIINGSKIFLGVDYRNIYWS